MGLLDNARDRLDLALASTQRLSRCFDEYMSSFPHQLVSEPQSDGTFAHKVRLKPAPEKDLSSIASETVGHLRSALDQACYAISSKETSRANVRQTYFPFGASREDVERSLAKGQSKDVPPAYRDYLLSLQPYQGGDDLLWAINDLRRRNEHRFITPIAMLAGKLAIKGLRARQIAISPPVWNNEDHSITVATTNGTPFDFEGLSINVHFAFTGAGELLDGVNAIAFLREASALVRAILDQIEAIASPDA